MGGGTEVDACVREPGEQDGITLDLTPSAHACMHVPFRIPGDAAGGPTDGDRLDDDDEATHPSARDGANSTVAPVSRW